MCGGVQSGSSTQTPNRTCFEFFLGTEEELNTSRATRHAKIALGLSRSGEQPFVSDHQGVMLNSSQ